ncbi:pro-melanin-concentrating hormone, like [Aplochiton taeniatus]
MRPSVITVVFATALFFDCYALSVTIPIGNAEEASFEQETFGSLLNEEAESNSVVADSAAMAKSVGPRIIVVPDVGLWRSLRAMDRVLPLHKQRGVESALTLDRRNVGPQDPSISIIRRDTMRLSEE